jgi:2-polyprenyl-3-methyl-5-hydroxy-6-metoxy-1,4-benzoquinol methylase
MSEQDKLEALDTYFDLMAMNGAMQVYHTARQLGILDAIGGGPCDAGEIAAACGLRDVPVRLLLDALCSLRLLQRDGDAYRHTAVMPLLAGQYRNLGNEYWDYLPQFLSSNVPLAAMDAPEQSEAQYQTQVTALAWMMQPAAEQVARLLEAGTARRGLNIIDLGAGAAVWSLTIAAHDATARVTAIDWPAVLNIAAAQASSRGLADRFTALPGNYHEVELPAGTYDLAIIGNVTHIETESGNRSLLEKLYAALRTGGDLAIIDVMSGQAQGDLPRTLYALGLAMRTENGRVYSRVDLEALLAETGYEVGMFHPLNVPPYTMGMILARKEGHGC